MRAHIHQSTTHHMRITRAPWTRWIPERARRGPRLIRRRAMTRADFATACLTAATAVTIAAVPKLISLCSTHWRAVSAVAYAVNVVAVSIPGRIDGEMQEHARRRKAQSANASASSPAIPEDSEFRSLFTPAGWAFAIWGVIYLGEAFGTALQVANAGDVAAVRGVIPYWACACALQTLCVVVAWALAAVASDGGKRTTETLPDAPLRALAKAARWGSRFALCASAFRAFVPKRA